MSADRFQLKRGTTAQVAAYLPSLGEPVYDTVLKRLTIGDGVTLGGVSVLSGYTPLPIASGGTGNVNGSAVSLTTARTIAITGDATYSVSFNGSANVTSALTLASVGTAGTYGAVTTDVKGRVTSGVVATPIANGGTGATTAPLARTALGVGTAGTVRFSATKSVAQAIPATTPTLVTLPTAAINVGAGFNTGSSRFVATVAGDYLFSFQVALVNAAASDVVTAQLFVNGVRHTSGPAAQSGALAINMASGGTAMVTLAATDFVELFVVSLSALSTPALSGVSFLNGRLLS